MIKRIVSFIVVLAISIVGLTNTVFAAEISPYLLYTDYALSTLTISGTTATCISEASGYVDKTTRIVISQTLQKKTSSSTWEKVTIWNEVDTGFKGYATNYAYNLSKGTYRLKSVFNVFSGTKFETVTKYSSEKTVK